ncbi:MAG: hypothetical protein MdMp014T_0336 [Treponematales bacterium]
MALGFTACPGGGAGGSDPDPTVTSVTVTTAGNAASVLTGGTLQFSAAVAGENSPSQTVVWSIETTGAASGTSISATGLLTVAPEETNEKLTIKAVSQQDTSKSGTKTVSVEPASTNAIATVSISGAGAWVGEVITATARDASGAVVIDAAFQWKRANDASGTGAADIPGATSATYTLAAADVGKYLAVEADNAATGTAALSEWGGPVLAATEQPYSIEITGIPAAAVEGVGAGAVYLAPEGGTAMADAVAMGPLREMSGNGPYTVSAALYGPSEEEESKMIPFRTGGTYDVYVLLMTEDYDLIGFYQKAGVTVSGETTTIAFSAFTDIIKAPLDAVLTAAAGNSLTLGQINTFLAGAYELNAPELNAVTAGNVAAIQTAIKALIADTSSGVYAYQNSGGAFLYALGEVYGAVAGVVGMAPEAED